MLKLAQLYGDHNQDGKALDIVQKAVNKDPYFVLAYLFEAKVLDKVYIYRFYSNTIVLMSVWVIVA